MDKSILFSILLALLFSCNIDSNNHQHRKYSQNILENRANPINNVRLDFTAHKKKDFNDIIEVNAVLFNDNIDTVYFLSSSCFGEQYSIQYDTSKFILNPLTHCQMSIPIIRKIAPKSKHIFQGHFKSVKKETKIKLGFDLYTVNENFILNNRILSEINIHNRPEDEQNIIWAEEKLIE